MVAQLLIQGLTLGLSAAFSPGPFQAYLLAKTLHHGWKRAMLAILAPLISDGPIIALMLLVLAQTPERFLDLIRIAGGLFLIFLAWNAYRGSRSQPGTQRGLPGTAPRSILEAAMVNALGPGPYLFWGLIAGPILLEGWRLGPAYGVAFLAGFYGTLLGGLAGIVALFATARRFGNQVAQTLGALAALALLAFGFFQLWQGLIGLGFLAR